MKRFVKEFANYVKNMAMEYPSFHQDVPRKVTEPLRIMRGIDKIMHCYNNDMITEMEAMQGIVEMWNSHDFG